MKASVYIATSLDGFIARENDELDWLPVPGEDGTNEDYGYKEFIDTVDFLVMGRHTYEKALTFGRWPYESKSVIVLSSKPVSIPESIEQSVESLSCSPSDLIGRLAVRGAKHLYVDGGRTIQRFLDAGLIQQLIITRVPVLIGSGIPLFGPLKCDIQLEHVKTRHFDNGLVQSKYDVVG